VKTADVGQIMIKPSDILAVKGMYVFTLFTSQESKRDRDVSDVTVDGFTAL